MHISKETASETNRRLLGVAKSSRIEPLKGEWYFEEFPAQQLPERVRSDALAVVRDGDLCSQLVQIRHGDRPEEKFRIWSCHFPPGMDNSGFIGWLATRIKRTTGCGVFVVCGQNSTEGGIYDYWGCLSSGARAVFHELREVVRRTNVAPNHRRRPSLNGVRMRVIGVSGPSVADRQTLFTFAQKGSKVTASYEGGGVLLGRLVGSVAADVLTFQYAQVGPSGRMDCGRSVCDLEQLPDGRVRLLEHYKWESRPGSGTNVLEEV